MIDFRCTCGFPFSVPAELAGDMMQCPQCHRLVDVPRFSELASLEEDGLYKVDDAPPPPADEQTIASIQRAFTRARFDDEGLPIDNRGVYDVAPAPVPAQPIKASTPKYDPFTGELIEEIKVVEPSREVLPVARPLPRPPRSKRKLMDEPTRFELAALPALLLRPINLLVMVFVFLSCMLGQAMVFGAAFNPAIGFFWFLLQAAIVAHFGNVVDETGPANRQELPVPLRSVDWGDDVFRPLGQTLLALLICFGPGTAMLITLKDAPPQIAIGAFLALALVGMLIFPAVWLTATTSGTIVNLRPDRVWSVVIAMNAEYILVLLTWTVGSICYVLGVAAITSIAVATAARASPLPVIIVLPGWLHWWSGYAILATGVYLLHLLGWQLGTLYRKHHARFTWAFQRFNKDELGDAAPTGFAVKKIRQAPAQAIPAQPFPEIEP